MRKILRKALGIISCLAFSVTPLMAGNVLTNPGFESDPLGENQTLLGWSAYGGNAYSETSLTLAHNGTNYFKVFQAFTSSTNYTGVYQDYISGPGAVYTADGWAYTLSGDKLAGRNLAWIEVTFRDANANVLALYRSAVITTNSLANGNFPVNAWFDLPVTNQYNPNTAVITNATTELVAPGGTYFVRYQIVFQGDPNNSGGSVYFDDLNLLPVGGSLYGNWNITWSDEFNGTNVDTTVWTNDLGNGSGGWGNNEREYYTSRTNNMYVSGGLLHIVAQKESTNGFSYTSARMKTQGFMSWTYGRFEWRAKFPAGTGFWPALWLLGTNITSVNWPGCGEIDVTENNGATPVNVQGSLHSGTDETAVYTFPDSGSVTNFHTYVLDWSPSAFLWYIDGHLYESQTSWGSSLGNPYPAPFDKPFFIVMNLAVGGNYLATNGVNPSITDINKSTFPAEMQVDYMRIYTQTSPLQISITNAGPQVTVSWPGNIICHLQTQINSLGTNWVDVITVTNSLQFIPGSNAAFYRLRSP